MNNNNLNQYDVVIMGAGFAGNCQARHLMLNIPNIKIALIDPRPEARTEKDLKLGESTVEVATLFIGKDLGLYEYVIENHPPKYGLNFHWPKKIDETKNLDDYYHIWANRQPDLASIQLNRSKFERDLLKMNKDMGATFYNGRVTDVDLTPGDALKTVTVKIGKDSIELKAKHVVDAAGRKFIIGRKKDNIKFGSDELYGVNTGAAWVRVKDVDNKIFHDGYDPNGASCSHYYATNHWFGHGHWLWMIPTDTQSKELSVGIVHHHEVIDKKSINTDEKYYAFLKENHNILYQLVTSGEKIDFHYWPRLAHTSKTMFSEDNWYVIGDSACIFDAFYSLGTTMVVSAIQNVTEIVRAKLAGEADAEQKRSAYNEFNLTFTDCVNVFMRGHTKQLGNASIMSWRIYFENMFWFGILVPLHIGKWHLDPKFIDQFIKTFQTTIISLLNDVHEQFDKLAEQEVNIGLMDCYRADQLVWDYHTPKRFDHTLEDARYEPGKSNIYVSMKNTFFYMAIWYFKLQWKVGGLFSVLKPMHIYHCFKLLLSAAYIAIGEQLYKARNKNISGNTEVERMREEFKDYSYKSELRQWNKDHKAHINEPLTDNYRKVKELAN